MAKILNYGSLNIDYVYDVDHFVTAGETLSSDNLFTNCGGKGLNQSIACAKAGSQIFHAGKIGENGDFLKDILESYNVDTSFVKKCDTPNGHAIIQVDKEGQNCILLFSGSNSEITESEVDSCFDNFEKGDYLLLQNEINLIPYIMNKAFEKGLNIVFNPSPINQQIYKYPIEKVSLLILNEVEGKALSGFDEAQDIINELKKKYPDTDILLTLGKNGAVFANSEKQISHGIYEADVVDSTAAGDTMTGYFVACIAKGESPERALEIASKASSITVTRNGAAVSIPTYDEVEKADLKLKQ